MRSMVTAIVFLLFITGCTPEYTIDSIDGFSKKVGVVDYFEITRWHHYVIAQNSRLAVVAQAGPPDESALLAKALSNAFSDYYAGVAVLADKQGQHGVIESARSQGYDFLLRAELLSAEPTQVADHKKQSYKHLKISVTIIDINSALVVDKILLSSSKARIPFVRGAIDNIVSEPLSVVAKELSGVQ